MSFVTIGLTTKALIRALQWQRIEAEENVQAKAGRKKSKPKGSAK